MYRWAMQFEGENRYMSISAKKSNYQNTLKSVASDKALRTARDLKEGRHTNFLHPQMEVLTNERVCYGTSTVIDMLWDTNLLVGRDSVIVVWGKCLHIAGRTFNGHHQWAFVRQLDSIENQLVKITAIFRIDVVIYVAYVTPDPSLVSTDGAVWTLPTAHTSSLTTVASLAAIELVKLHHRVKGSQLRFMKR